jgi:transcriptional regulator with XRE-family HTH domain
VVRGWSGHPSPAVCGERRSPRRCTAETNDPAKYTRSGIVAVIDPSYLIEIARRARGLSQAELARQAGTSQAAVSAYERGLKTPSIAVAARLLGVLGWELTLRSRVTFTEHHPKGIVAFWAPNRLWRVPTPDCFATLYVPDLLGHTEQDQWNLGDPADRRRAYEILIRRGMPQMMIRWLDGGFLVDLWDELDLPDPVRTAWGPAVRGASRSHSSNVFSWTSGEAPETGPLASIEYLEFLPKPPPPPPPRRSRFDPRP